jgi:hypothetical protein
LLLLLYKLLLLLGWWRTRVCASAILCISQLRPSTTLAVPCCSAHEPKAHWFACCYLPLQLCLLPLLLLLYQCPQSRLLTLQLQARLLALLLRLLALLLLQRRNHNLVAFVQEGCELLQLLAGAQMHQPAQQTLQRRIKVLALHNSQAGSFLPQQLLSHQRVHAHSSTGLLQLLHAWHAAGDGQYGGPHSARDVGWAKPARLHVQLLHGQQARSTGCESCRRMPRAHVRCCCCR